MFKSPFIIAEMACAHNGVKEEALQLIDASVKAKADAIQLQFFVPDETLTPNHEAWNIINKIAFLESDWKYIVDYAKTKNILIFVCTYDLISVRWAIKMKVDGIKLNSSDLSNPEVLLAVAKSKIPFTLGTGASTMEEINSGLLFCCNNGAENIVLMHGVQNFPTNNKDLNISRVGLLKKMFSKYKIGYADHTEGGDSFGLVIDLVALGNGAEVFEKHITIDRSEKGVDYQAALEPEEFIVYCNNLRKAAEAFGNGELKKLSESDLKYRKFQKKSIVAKNNISKGTILERKHIYFVRNVEPGIPPIDIDAFIGKKIKKDISKYDNIKYSDIDI